MVVMVTITRNMVSADWRLKVYNDVGDSESLNYMYDVF